MAWGPRLDQKLKADALWRWMTRRKPMPRPAKPSAHNARLRALDILLGEYKWDQDGFGLYVDGYTWQDHNSAISWLAKNGYVKRRRSKSSTNYGRNYIEVTELGIEAQKSRKFGADPLPKTDRRERDNWVRRA